MQVDERDYRYGQQKLWLAVDTLATGTGSIQDRLESAAMTLTILERPPALAPDAQKELERINKALTKVEAKGSEGRIKATLRTVSNEEGRMLAEQIISLYLLARGGMCED